MNYLGLTQLNLNELLSLPNKESPLKAYIETVNGSSTSVNNLNSRLTNKSSELQQENNRLKQEIEFLEKNKSALLSAYALMEAGFNSTYDGLLMLDVNGNIRLSNQTFKKLFKLENETQNLETVTQLVKHIDTHLSSTQTLSNAIRSALKAPQTGVECEFKTTDNIFVEAHSRPHKLGHEIVGQMWTFRDVTQAKLNEEEAKHRAYHDSLTGLPNRRLLSLKLNQTLNAAKKNGSKTAVLFIDLDGFKDVNDSLGHSVGDALLKDVSSRLEAILPAGTVLARHGGDEFVAVMGKQQDEQLAIQFCQRVMDCFASPFELCNEHISMSVSIGVTIAPDYGDEADKLISNADMAMYQAKQKGKNTYEFFNTSKDTEAYHRLTIRNQINVALENKEFELFFQPKICLESGSIKGAEALIRWKSEDGSFRSPMEFIPIAEESGQIIPISQWVIQRCGEHLNDWKSHLDDDFVLALNISAKHFQKGQLQADMAQVLNQLNIDPSKLELEVTETAIMDDLDLAVDTLNELKKLGIRTAIDDFGTGHSSLSYLRKLPIEVLKIDKSFIDEILISQEDRTLVKGIIDMVHALGIEVVAEGVENHQMAELLQEMNCDLVQGFHYCKPISEADFIELIKSRQCYI